MNVPVLSIPKYKFISSELTLSEMYQPIYIIITHSSPTKDVSKETGDKVQVTFVHYIIYPLFWWVCRVCVCVLKKVTNVLAGKKLRLVQKPTKLLMLIFLKKHCCYITVYIHFVGSWNKLLQLMYFCLHTHNYSCDNIREVGEMLLDDIKSHSRLPLFPSLSLLAVWDEERESSISFHRDVQKALLLLLLLVPDAATSSLNHHKKYGREMSSSVFSSIPSLQHTRTLLFSCTYIHATT